MPPRRAVPRCSNPGCLLILPKSIRHFAELDGGWAIEHASGGAHGIHLPHWTGRRLCRYCFMEQRPPKARGVLRAVCDDCAAAPVKYRQIAHAWTELPKANDVLDARYSALALCEPCFVSRLEGEQLRLFDA